jgi:hypothetical protein
VSGTPVYQGANQPPPGGGWFNLWNWGNWRSGNTPAYRGGHGGHGGPVVVHAAEGSTFAIEEAPLVPTAITQGTTVCTSDATTTYQAAPFAIVIPRQT